MSRLADKPCEITVADDALWVVTQSGVVERVDPSVPSGPKVVASVPTAFASYQAAEAFDSIWVTNRNGQSPTRIDPATNKATTVDLPGLNAGGVVAAGDALWVSCVRSGRVVAVDATTGATTGEPVPAGASPVNLRASPDGRWVWVPDDQTGLLTRIDTSTGTAVEVCAAA